jgi:hypothetical protein
MTECQCVLEGMTEGLGRDVNATSRPRRMVAAHGKVVAGSWRGTARLGLGLASRHGSWPPRAAALPCRVRGTGILGPRHDAAAEGDGGCGMSWGTMGPCIKSGTAAGWEKGGPKAGYRGIIGGPWLTPAARDREMAHRGLAGGRPDAVASRCRWVRAVQGAPPRRSRRTGAGMVKALQR